MQISNKIRGVSRALIASSLIFGPTMALCSQSVSPRALSRQIVLAYLAKYSQSTPTSLAVSCANQKELAGVIVCDVAEEASVSLQKGKFSIVDKSHYSSWRIAFVGSEAFKLQGFGSENDFNRLFSALHFRVASRSQALKQLRLYLHLVYRDDAPTIISNGEQLVRTVNTQSNLNIDPKLQDLLSKDSVVLKTAITPPKVTQAGSDFVGAFFGLHTRNRQLLFSRFEFRISSGGAVHIAPEPIS
jgi:hypothetical protein